MPRGKCKGEENVLLRQGGGKRSRTHVVADEYDVFCFVRSKRIHYGIKLRIAHYDKYNIICIVCFKLRYDRNAAYRYAGRKLILYPKPVLLNFLRPFSARKQRYVFSCAEHVVCQIAAEYASAKYQYSHIYVPHF